MARLTRIYANGSKVTLNSDAPTFHENYASVEDWRKYNETFRFGNALFIDGVCVYKGPGYHFEEDLARYAEEEKLAMTKGTNAPKN